MRSAEGSRFLLLITLGVLLAAAVTSALVLARINSGWGLFIETVISGLLAGGLIMVGLAAASRDARHYRRLKRERDGACLNCGRLPPVPRPTTCASCGHHLPPVQVITFDSASRANCMRCGYDLRGLRSDRCPECAEPLAHADAPADRPSQPRPPT